MNYKITSSELIYMQLESLEEKREEKYLRKFPHLMRTMSPQIQEAQEIQIQEI